VSGAKEIRYFTDTAGRCPYAEWFDRLDPKARYTLMARIDRLTGGNPGRVNAVGEGVHELKIDLGPGYRIYFANDADTILVILAGGTKRRQSQDIARAKDYWRLWKRQKGDDV